MALADTLTPFLWGAGGSKKTPEQVAREREIAAALMQGGMDYSPVDHWLQGAARASQGLVGGLKDTWANEAEQEGIAGARNKFGPQIAALLGGGSMPGSPSIPTTAVGAATDMGTGDFLDSLVASESGGNWSALNDEGYGGRLQFGDARLADAAAAGIIPAGMTGADFSMMTPEVQQAVEQWHFADIDQQTANMGLNQYFGQTIAGVPITPESVKAMAHLGGIGGVQKFIASGGQYNPADSNGTRLSDYGARFGGAAGSPGASASPAAGALIAEALSDPWAMQTYGPVVEALFGQQLQQQDPAYQLDLALKQAQLDAANAPAGPEYGFTFAPDGTLIRTDTTSGTFDPMGSYPKPESGPLVSIVNGDGAPGLGKLSTDYGYVLDPETGQPVIDPATGLPTAAAVPGSPAALEAAAAATKAETGAGRREVATDVVTTAASIARNLAAKPGNTGLTGAVWANLSETEAAEMRRQVDVLKATATIENLTAMRQASPTGGALGSVTEKEGAMLAAASGAIDPNSSGPDFQRALDNYERTLLQIVHGPTEGDRIFNETRQSGGNANFDYNAPEAPEGWGGDPALWRFMSPEDRALW